MSSAVWVVILNYDSLEDTLACLASLQTTTYPNCNILVLDNSSRDGSVEAIRSHYPQVNIIELPENLGYAGNNNVGIREALASGADWVLILNADTVVDPACLEELVRVGESQSGVGIVGPKVYQADAPAEIQAAGGILNRHFEISWRGMGEKDQGQYEVIDQVDVARGCAIMVHRQVFEAIGTFDSRFFMYREEVDLCLRAKRAGYKILYVPTAKVWHRRPDVHPAKRPFITYHMVRNNYLLLSKSKASVLEFVLATARNLIWLANWTFNPKWQHKREERDALFKGLIDALRGNYGKQAYRYGL